MKMKFKRVNVFKPASSRDRSFETFIVARDYLWIVTYPDSVGDTYFRSLTSDDKNGIKAIYGT